jgi:hypothetical protein
MTIWNYILAALASLSAEPDALEQERPRAAAAVAIAMASMKPDEPIPASESECEGDNCPAPKGVVKP